MPIEESTPAKLTVSELRDVYSRLASLYGFWEMLGQGRVRLAALDLVRPRSGERLLEIAVGPGVDLAHLAASNAGGITIGADVTAAMLHRAMRRIRDAGIPSPALCQCDARFLPFEQGAFDRVFCAYMLDSLTVADAERAISEMHRVLAVGGRLIILHMSSAHRWFNYIWAGICWLVPNLVGGCRPIRVASHLSESGFAIERVRSATQWGVPLEIVAAIRK